MPLQEIQTGSTFAHCVSDTQKTLMPAPTSFLTFGKVNPLSTIENSKRAHLKPQRFKHQNFTRRHPREGRKNENCERERVKISPNFWHPPFRPIVTASGQTALGQYRFWLVPLQANAALGQIGLNKSDLSTSFDVRLVFVCWWCCRGLLPSPHCSGPQPSPTRGQHVHLP